MDPFRVFIYSVSCCHTTVKYSNFEYFGINSLIYANGEILIIILMLY